MFAYRRNYAIGGPAGIDLIVGRILATVNLFIVFIGIVLLLWNVAMPSGNSSTRYLAALLLLLLIATYVYLKAGFDLKAFQISE